MALLLAATGCEGDCTNASRPHCFNASSTRVDELEQERRKRDHSERVLETPLLSGDSGHGVLRNKEVTSREHLQRVKVSGIAANGVNVQDNDLNTRLREALGIASGVVEDNGAHDEEPEDESPEEGNVFADDDDEEDFFGFDIDTELVLNNDIDSAK